MKDEILVELLNEILKENKEIRTESKEIRNEQQFLKTAFENFASQEKEALDRVKNLKVNIDLAPIMNSVETGISAISNNVKKGIIELQGERKEIVMKISNWRNDLISISKLLLYLACFYFIILLFGKYYMPVVREKQKFKSAYEYIYYNGTINQDYYQQVILEFDKRKSKKELIKLTNKLKEESTNPLVWSK